LTQRKLILPRDPEGSLLLDLVDGGSMPPGRHAKVSQTERDTLREWVRAGAPSFPPETGRDYLLRQLVENFAPLDKEQQPHTRYLSLNHLKPGDTAARTAALRALLRFFSAAGKPATLTPVDPTGTLFRIDLRDLGWDRRPFKGEPLNLFDLLQLEYPYGVLPPSPWSPGLADFLRPTQQTRPVPFIRGDWLARMLSTPPLRDTFLEVLGKPAGATPPSEAKMLFPPSEVGFDDAVRELETSLPADRVKKILNQIDDLKPLAQGKPLKREAWERSFYKAVRESGDTPIIPLNGLTWTDHDPGSDLKVQLRLVDPKDPGLPNDPAPKRQFVSGKDGLAIWIHANEDVFIDLAYADTRGKVTLLTEKVVKKDHLLHGNKPLTVEVTGKGKDAVGQRFLILYAYPAKGFGPAPWLGRKMIREGGLSAQVVHPLYELSETGRALRSPDPGRMVKITLPFSLVKP
jgi:hypothetical protein